MSLKQSSRKFLINLRQYFSVSSQNTVKYGPEKSPSLDTFQTVTFTPEYLDKSKKYT